MAIAPNYTLNDIASLKCGSTTMAKGVAVKFDASAVDFVEAATASSATFPDCVAGITLETGTDGNLMNVMTSPGKIVIAKAGDTITAGANVMVESGGTLIPAALTTAQNCLIVGQALEAATDGSYFALLFQPKIAFDET